MPPEPETLKFSLKAMWMAGDYGHFARYLEAGAMEFFPNLQITPGKRVLDVACGAGQLSPPAATGVDIATNLIGAMFAPRPERGAAEFVCERLLEDIDELQVARKLYPLKYPFPPADVVEFFRTHYGPTNRAFDALDTDGQAALRNDLEQLWSDHNRAGDSKTEVYAESLEVTAVRA